MTSISPWRPRRRRDALGAGGFTLIELLVVILILGLLAAVAVFAVGTINDRAKMNACKSEQDTVDSAVAAYYFQADAYPVNMDKLTKDGNAPGGIFVKAQLKTDPTYWKLAPANDGSLVASSSLPAGCG